MIAKIVKGKGFRGLANYLLAENRSQIIGGTMAGRTPRELSVEFAQFRKLRPTLGRAVAHISLAASPDDPPMNDERWDEIAQRVLKGLGYGECAQLIVRHREDETAHEHIHIVASCIDTKGRNVTDSNDYRRAEAILRRIEADFSLKPVDSPTRRSSKNRFPLPTKTTLEKTMTDQNGAGEANDVKQAALSLGVEVSSDMLFAAQDSTAPSCFAGDNPNDRQKRNFRRATREKNYMELMRDLLGEPDLRVFSHRGGATLYFNRPKNSRINDNGDKLTAYGMSDAEAAQRLISIANSRGWSTIVFTGSDEFVQTALRIAVANGMSVRPANPEQQALLDLIMAEGGRGGIGAAAAPKTPRSETAIFPSPPKAQSKSPPVTPENSNISPFSDISARLAYRRQQKVQANEPAAKMPRSPRF